MDHERVNYSNLSISCGVAGINRISGETEEAVYAIASRLYHPSRGDPAAFLVWSDIVTDSFNPAVQLARYFNENGLGLVSESSPSENPKTGNIISVFVCLILHEQFKDWYKIQRGKKLQKVGT